MPRITRPCRANGRERPTQGLPVGRLAEFRDSWLHEPNGSPRSNHARNRLQVFASDRHAGSGP
jgi:hypothetical protein